MKIENQIASMLQCYLRIYQVQMLIKSRHAIWLITNFTHFIFMLSNLVMARPISICYEIIMLFVDKEVILDKSLLRKSY